MLFTSHVRGFLGSSWRNDSWTLRMCRHRRSTLWSTLS